MHDDKICGATSAFVAKEWFTDEPYILATQVKHVFYVKDLLKGDDWEIVEECNHRWIWEIPEVDGNSASNPLTVQLSNFNLVSHRHETGEVELVTDIDDEDDDDVDDDEDETRLQFEGDDVDVDVDDGTNVISSDDE